jgi:predicted transcriptional regulator
MQEASKHVARLKDQNFIEKNSSDGYYILTTLGKLVTKPASIPTLHVDTFI